MPSIIKYRNELIRICPTDRKKLEFSTNGGIIWFTRCQNTICGEFYDLFDNGTEILASTAKGLFFSKDAGRTWLRRN